MDDRGLESLTVYVICKRIDPALGLPLMEWTRHYATLDEAYAVLRQAYLKTEDDVTFCVASVTYQALPNRGRQSDSTDAVRGACNGDEAGRGDS